MQKALKENVFEVNVALFGPHSHFIFEWTVLCKFS